MNAKQLIKIGIIGGVMYGIAELSFCFGKGTMLGIVSVHEECFTANDLIGVISDDPRKRCKFMASVAKNKKNSLEKKIES